MPPAGYFIDTNLLVLRVVGDVSKDLIQKHRRLKTFVVEDYDRLMDLLRGAPLVLVTPNTLTETSNLLAQHGEPERSRFLDQLRFLIQNSREIVVSSADASTNSIIQSAWSHRRSPSGNCFGKYAAGHYRLQAISGRCDKRPVFCSELYTSEKSDSVTLLPTGNPRGCHAECLPPPRPFRIE